MIEVLRAYRSVLGDGQFVLLALVAGVPSSIRCRCDGAARLSRHGDAAGTAAAAVGAIQFSLGAPLSHLSTTAGTKRRA